MINNRINRIGLSTRTLSRKFHFSHITVNRQLKENEIKYCKRKRTPKYKKSQFEKLSRC